MSFSSRVKKVSSTVQRALESSRKSWISDACMEQETGSIVNTKEGILK